MLSRTIVRATTIEFETSDGEVRPMYVELDKTPTVNEFQEVYDDLFKVLIAKGLIKPDK